MAKAVYIYPHVRGVYHDKRTRLLGLFRFIPTYVGFTYVFSNSAYRLTGSSPHTWGLPVFLRLPVERLRFIPTYVGFTNTRCPIRSRQCGSSPHTWGLLVNGRAIGQTWRFIPTYVGFTKCAAHVGVVIIGSSPHTWGLRVSQNPVKPGIGGSSPHTWGLQINAVDGRVTSRFIPTYVGFTLKKDSSFCEYDTKSSYSPEKKFSI